jgi:hypothetical protein
MRCTRESNYKNILQYPIKGGFLGGRVTWRSPSPLGLFFYDLFNTFCIYIYNNFINTYKLCIYLYK